VTAARATPRRQRAVAQGEVLGNAARVPVAGGDRTNLNSDIEQRPFDAFELLALVGAHASTSVSAMSRSS
jgi:hypothetical protein